MKRYSQRVGGTLLSELNVTPLIDLAFTLLIIFMITAPLMEHSLEINLPKSETSDAPPPPQTVREVAVDGQGQIFFEGMATNLDGLARALNDMVAADPEAAVSLRADEGLRYQQLVRVLEAIKNSGARLGLATAPES